jgi:NADH dehydrogenase
MLRRLPVFPLFGGGQTRLQPAYVDDVAEAIARAVQNSCSEMCYELGGPRVYTYKSLLEVIAREPRQKAASGSCAVSSSLCAKGSFALGWRQR